MEHAASIDIEGNAALEALAEALRTTGGPIVLRRDGRPVADVVPRTGRRAMSPEQIEIFRSTFGAWAHVDAEARKAMVREARDRATRPRLTPHASPLH